ncbi:LysR family transcriptional regulator [Vibrio sp. S9_S30]|uniref:LysR family transcriptional regulator n=1 Tax=Vibrio sp. S9_S30 TaxID=2720226 RepID=UPI0016803463|nr:LysR family transcriptional regulator [Vibrio sp. S9_S30]MBD1559467.1 LysR family transcriptional regulator [Vibrio sp. S9_S30]
MHTLDQLNAFVEVYESGSYSAAAKKLKKDRTTIRELIKAYEDGLGLELFSIIGRKAVPTEYAVKLINQARIVIIQNQSLVQYGHSLYEKGVDELKIGYESSFPTDFIEKIEELSLLHYPNLRVHWIVSSRLECLDALMSGDMDFALLSSRGMVYAENPVQFTHLGYVPFGLYVGKESKWTTKKRISMDDIHNSIQYQLEERGNDSLIQPFANHTRKVNDFSLLLSFLRKNGWAYLPQHRTRYWVEKGELIKKESALLAKDYKIPFSVFTRVGSENLPVHVTVNRWFYEYASMYLD